MIGIKAQIENMLKFIIPNLFNYYPGGKFIVFNYHRVYKNNLVTDFDDAVFGPSIDIFEIMMKWLKKNTDIISEKDLIDCQKNSKILPKHASLVTFDDGYIDNYSLAFPILKALEIPAIFFLPTNMIENRKLEWWDIIAYLIKKTAKSTISINSQEISVKNNIEKKNAISYIQLIMKSVIYEESKQILTQLSSQCEVDFPSMAKQNNEIMNWDQIKEINQHNITVGAHTHSHRVLATLDIAEQIAELQKSKQILEKRLGIPIHSLAYPVGNYSAFTDDTKKAAQSAGFLQAFSFDTGVNYSSQLDSYDIRRVGPATLMQFVGYTVFPSVLLKK